MKQHIRKVRQSNMGRTWSKIWYFIWEDDSWASWFVNIVLAFVIIKFLVYPGLGLAFGTNYPIVAVVSQSMEHDGDFDQWWEKPATCAQACTQGDFYHALGISKNEFMDFRFWNGFNKGDLMVLVGTDPEDIEIGDVIVFHGGRSDPIIHRVVMKSDTAGYNAFTTKGDYNKAIYGFESYIPEDALVGRAVVRIPYLGYVKIGAVWVLSLFGV